MNISPILNRQNYNITFNKNNSSNNSKVNDESKSLKINQNKINDNSLINNLEKYKKNLLKQKEKLQGEEMDPEQKKEKMKEINEQLANLESELQQAKMLEKQKEQEKIEEQMEKNKQETEKDKKNYNDKINGVVVDESLKKLIEARKSLDNTKNLKSTQGNLKVELSYLEHTGSQRLDNTSNTSFVSKQKQKLQKGIVGLEHKIYNEIGKSNKKVDSLEETIKENSKDFELKTQSQKEKMEAENETK